MTSGGGTWSLMRRLGNDHPCEPRARHVRPNIKMPFELGETNTNQTTHRVPHGCRHSDLLAGHFFWESPKYQNTNNFLCRFTTLQNGGPKTHATLLPAFQLDAAWPAANQNSARTRQHRRPAAARRRCQWRNTEGVCLNRFITPSHKWEVCPANRRFAPANSRQKEKIPK